jgi:hypothetical protein
MNNYKITACLLSDAEAQKDLAFIANVSKPESERIETLRHYPIDGAIEEHDTDVPCYIDMDADGVYLLEKI